MSMGWWFLWWVASIWTGPYIGELGFCHMPEWLRCTSSITTACSSMSTVEVLQQCNHSFGHNHSFCTGKETVWQLKQTVCKILVLSSLCQHSLNVRLLPTCSKCIQYDPSFQHSLILTRYFDLHQMVSTLSVNILYSWSCQPSQSTSCILEVILQHWKPITPRLCITSLRNGHFILTGCHITKVIWFSALYHRFSTLKEIYFLLINCRSFVIVGTFLFCTYRSCMVSLSNIIRNYSPSWGIQVALWFVLLSFFVIY
jgi:hypothetical protein